MLTFLSAIVVLGVIVLALGIAALVVAAIRSRTR